MKKYLYTTIVLSLFFFNQIQAQYQSIYGDSTTKWVSHYWILPLSGPDCQKDTTLIGNRDTLINGQVFKSLTTYLNGNSNPYNVSFIGEDTSSGSVWIRQSSGMDTTITKIMQLNLTLNDSFDLSFLNAGNVAIDSIYYSNGKKHIELDHVVQISTDFNNSVDIKYTMIEGVGVNTSRVIPGLSTGSVLQNQFKDDTLHYSIVLDSALMCNTITNLKTNSYDQNAFDFYPNPATNFISLEVNEALKVKEIQLIDITGKLIREFPASNRMLNLNSVSNGVYFLSVTTNQGRMIEKVLVKH